MSQQHWKIQCVAVALNQKLRPKKPFKKWKMQMLSFLRCEILKANDFLNADDQCYPVCQFILPSHCIFILFSCTVHYTFQRAFYIVLSKFLFLFNQWRWKADVVNQMIHSCFRVSSTMGQLNVVRWNGRNGKVI